MIHCKSSSNSFFFSPSLSSGKPTLSSHPVGNPPPFWDGSRIRFRISVGGEGVPCAISRSALEALAARRSVAGAGLLGIFLGRREQIERMARGKLEVMPGRLVGTLNIWVGDLDEPPFPGGSLQALSSTDRLSA